MASNKHKTQITIIIHKTNTTQQKTNKLQQIIAKQQTTI